MASMTLQEALAQVDEIAKELGFYDAGPYKQLHEQTVVNKCRDSLEKVKTVIMAKEPDGTFRADKLSTHEWRKIASLVAPVARCFTATAPSPVTPTSKTRHASATAVAALALLSSCNNKSKVIVNSALENGVVDAFVATLRNSLRNPVSDRVVKAMLYKVIEALWGFTLYATPQHQSEMVARDVVNTCIDLVTSATVETESKLNASKTLFNCLLTVNSSSRSPVSELRASKVAALNAQLGALAAQIPDPPTAAALAAGGGAKAISMPVMLPAFMSWIWFLPHYILDHLIDTLGRTLARIVVLAWPEGAPGIPLMAEQQQPPGGRADAADDPSAPPAPATPPVVAAGPLQVAQISLPNRALRNTMQTLFKSVSSGIADPRLVSILRGARLPAAAEAAAADGATAATRGTGLPARLVRVVREGRPDGTETKVALELLDELFACDANGEHPELADDALAAGLLASLSELGVLDALRSEAGLAGVAAFVRLAFKLVRRAPYNPGLAGRLHDSGVPASVAYLAFMPATKVSLKLEALQTLREMVQLDTDMTEHVVAMNNFPMALTNTLLGGDPDVARKPPTKMPSKKASGGSSKKKGGAAAAAAAAAAASAAADLSGGGANALAGLSSRNYRDQMQETAFDILTVVLDVARESDKVWETVVGSGMLPRLVQHAGAFPMQPSLLAELLLAVGLTFRDHRDDAPPLAPTATSAAAATGGDGPVVACSVGGLQAACAPHLLPLLLHEEPMVAGAAARVLKDILLDMARYRAAAAGSAQAAEGEDILRALVAAGGAAIDNADGTAARVAAAAAAKATATAATGAEAGAGEGQGLAVVKVEPGSAACPGPLVTAPPASAGSTAEAMDVDAPSTSAPDGAAAGNGGANGNAAEPSGGAGAAAAANTAAAAAPDATEADVPELVDVTAHGLGLMCAAMQSCVATVLQRPRATTPASSPAAVASAAAASLPAVSTASSPQPAPRSGGGAASGTAAAGPTAIVLDGPAYESLEALLLSCRVLGEACLQMPTHEPVRRHLARAFAYAKPPAEELAAALAGLADPEDAQLLLLSDTREVVAVMERIPVLDTALLPRPKPEEDEEAAKDAAPAAGTAAGANGVARKGRPPGSSKRASQGNLAADGATAQQPAPQQPSSKRQRTASAVVAAAAAAAAAAATVAADDAGAAGSQAPPTGSPRIAALRAAAAAAEGRNGVDAQGPPPMAAAARRAAPEGLPPLLPPLRGRASAAPGPGSEASGAAAAAASVPAVPAAPPAMGGTIGLGLPLPAGLHLVRAPPPGHPVGHPPPGPSRPAGALAESPSMSLDKRSNSLPGSATAAAAAAAAPPGGATATNSAGAASDGAGGAAGKGRLSAAEFRARYLEMKDANAKMATELEELRAAKGAAESEQRRTAAALAALAEEAEALRQQLAAAREVAAEAQAAVSVATAGLRELEALRAENAELKAELANLADLE